jgi:hypothetical protein
MANHAPPEKQNTRRMLAYYRERPGEVIHYADAADDLGIPKATANAAIGRIATRYPEMGFKRTGPQGHYVFLSNAPGPEKPHGYTDPETLSAPGLKPFTPETSESVNGAPEAIQEVTVTPVNIPKYTEVTSDGIGEMYEGIYRMKSSGQLVVRDYRGNLYTIKEL